MGKITAKGKKHGFTLTVEFDMEKILFNGKEDEVMEDELLERLESPEAVGGTYYPPVDSLLNAYNILRYHYFDEPTDDIVVKGELEEIPYEEDMIY